jgi:hypothetical protein
MDQQRIARWSLTALYIGVLLLFGAVWFQDPVCKDCFLNFYTNVYLIISLAGAGVGLFRLRSMSREKDQDSANQRILAIFSLGLLLWSVGQMIWLLYNRIGQEIPYPSWADAFYFTTIVCWFAAITLIYHSIRTNIFQEFSSISTIIVMFWGAVAYLIFSLRGDGFEPADGMLKLFLDLGYPILGAANAGLLWLIVINNHSWNKFKHPAMRKSLLVLAIGVTLHFLADFSFNVTTSLPKDHEYAYYNGNFTDFMYMTALWIISLGITWIPLNNFEATRNSTPQRPRADPGGRYRKPPRRKRP